MAVSTLTSSLGGFGVIPGADCGGGGQLGRRVAPRTLSRQHHGSAISGDCSPSSPRLLDPCPGLAAQAATTEPRRGRPLPACEVLQSQKALEKPQRCSEPVPTEAEAAAGFPITGTAGRPVRNTVCRSAASSLASNGSSGARSKLSAIEAESGSAARVEDTVRTGLGATCPLHPQATLGLEARSGAECTAGLETVGALKFKVKHGCRTGDEDQSSHRQASVTCLSFARFLESACGCSAVAKFCQRSFSSAHGDTTPRASFGGVRNPQHCSL